MKLLFAYPFIWILLASTLAQADDFDFKGIAFGSSVETLKDKHPQYFCQAPQKSLLSDMSCRLSEEIKCMGEMGANGRVCREAVIKEKTFAGVPANISLMYYEGKLGMAYTNFASSDFLKVITALREKYGKPSSMRTESITNRMGAVFENQILEWKRSETTIRAEKYTSSLDKSSVKIFSDSYSTESKKRMDAKAAQGANDL